MIYEFCLYNRILKILAISLLVLLCGTTSASDHEMSSREEIRRIVEQSLYSWETGDEESLLSVVHPDLVFAFPGTRTDADGAMRVFRYWKQHYKDTKIYIHWIIIDGNRFAAEYQFATTEIETGQRSAAGTVAIGRVENGKITLLKEYVDGRVTRLQASGELPLDEGKEPWPWPPSDRKMPWSE